MAQHSRYYHPHRMFDLTKDEKYKNVHIPELYFQNNHKRVLQLRSQDPVTKEISPDLNTAYIQMTTPDIHAARGGYQERGEAAFDGMKQTIELIEDMVDHDHELNDFKIETSDSFIIYRLSEYVYEWIANDGRWDSGVPVPVLKYRNWRYLHNELDRLDRRGIKIQFREDDADDAWAIAFEAVNGRRLEI